MDKRVLSIGIVLLVIGIILIFAFWPLTAVGGRDISTDDYEVGDRVTIYGTITDITGIGEVVLVELDGDTDIIVEQSREEFDFEEGDVVYGEIRLSQEL